MPVWLSGFRALCLPLFSLAIQLPATSAPAHDSFTVRSRVLGEPRLINVYVPPRYRAQAGNAATRLPVLYMPDGGLDEDFPHVVHTVDSLIARGVIRPVIVVGVPNTERRRDLTGPTRVKSDSAIAPRVGGSAAFRRFLREELVPEVERRYRTTRERTIIGESLAGLFIVETFLEEPTLFTHYIALDPSLWWNTGVLVDSAMQWLVRFDSTSRTLYLASSREPSSAVGSARLDSLLRAAPPPGLRWTYEPRPDLEHSTIFRALKRAALVDALRSASAQSLDPSDARLLRRSLNERPYRLWVPADYDGSRSYPLVMFLHGGGGRGRDNERHLLDGNGMLVNMFVTAQPRFPSIVLAPQTDSEHAVEPTVAVLRHVLKEYRVDRTRMYLIGQSLGGYGALDLLAGEPTLFAAAVVIAAGGPASRARRYAVLPTWFFHGERDDVVPVEQPRRIVAAIKRAGGSVRYTEYSGEGHGLAWLVAREDSLVPWIFRQRRP